MGHRGILDRHARSISYLTCTTSRGSKNSLSRNSDPGPFRVQVQRALFAEGSNFGMLAVALGGHHDLPGSHADRDNNYAASTARVKKLGVAQVGTLGAIR